MAVWDGAALGGSSTRTRAPGAGAAGGRPARGARKPIGLPSRRPDGLLVRLKEMVAGLFTSVEDVALLVLFLAFVGFAVHWFWLIL